ncbi:uncharacterized protein L3040_006655 [Drepanopeziza brunnea f. sp. 'multigermtubi']|nr:hypothetical protein L3040_006655 [Drepanopeziza brunnea f. sp. 'multigermtubi']
MLCCALALGAKGPTTSSADRSPPTNITNEEADPRR